MDSAPPGQVSQPGLLPPLGSRGRVAMAGGYCLLLLAGIAQGMIGSFQYSGGIGPVPGAALAFDALIFVTCVFAAWGMRGPAAGLMPAVGWFAASSVLAMGTPGGSIVITNTAAGKWFLFGGAICAAAGVVVGFARWSRVRPARSGGPGPRKRGS